MKKVLLITLLATISVFLSSCSTKELTKDQSEVIFSHEVKATKVELKTKILSFISEKFGSGKTVIQVNEDGLVSGNAIRANFSYDLLHIYGYSLEYTFLIKYQDNSYKVKYIVKNLYMSSSNSKVDINPSMWGNYAEEVKIAFEDFDKRLYEYVTNKADNF